jgi:hypothetical protein
MRLGGQQREFTAGANAHAPWLKWKNDPYRSGETINTVELLS